MPTLLPGQQLAGTSYAIVRELGAGGMGVVYEIEHVRLKKRYVAKIIHEEHEHEEGATKRMQREAQVLAAITHPNVVQIHDVGVTTDGVSYFVMEKLEGCDLRRLMKSQRIGTFRAMSIVADVLDALDYVHRRGIVHRDIKPENVFLAETPLGTITKVLDFGIVHVVDTDGHGSQRRITKTGGFVGTLYYAAPEQMQGNAASPSNDVYAAALVLFELVAARGPFDDDPGVGLSRCFKPAPRLSELVPSAPPRLVDALARALEQDPARRPSAGALASELRAIALTLDTAPGPDADPVRAEVHDLLRGIEAPPEAAPAARPVRTPPPAPATPGTPGEVERPHVSTSPGLYSTVDDAPKSTPATRSSLAPAMIAAAVLLVGIGGVAAAIAVRSRAASTTAAAPPPATTTPQPARESTPPPPPAVARVEPAPAAPIASASASVAPPAKPAPAKPTRAIAPPKPVAAPPVAADAVEVDMDGHVKRR